MAQMPNRDGTDEFNLAQTGQNRQISSITLQYRVVKFFNDISTIYGPGVPEDDSSNPLAPLGALTKSLWHLTIHLFLSVPVGGFCIRNRTDQQNLVL